MLTRKKVNTNVLFLVGIIILLNIIALKFFFRLDFTADQRYSLSDATKNILENLNDPVTVTAYFSEDLPPDIEKVRQDFRDLLIEYSNYSGGQIVYEFINPNEDQQTEMKAQQAGIGPIMINVRERDQMKQQRAYLGAVVQMGEQKESIPLIQPGSAMEFALSTNIKKITVKNKPVVGLLQGNGEPALSALQQVNDQLSVLYQVQPVTLSDTAGVPDNISTLMVIAPADSVPVQYFNYIDQFINRGGKLLLAVNTVKGDFSTAQGSVVKTGFAEWLKKIGLEIEGSFIVDANCSNVMVRQQTGGFVMNTPVSFPYIPIISNFIDHPITNGLEAVVMPFASPVRIVPKDTSLMIYPLAKSSEKAGTLTPPLYFDINKKWRQSDFLLPDIPVAVAVEGNILGGANTKMVVFGDGDFPVNGEGQQAQKLQPDNVNLLVNAVDWLSDDTGLIDLRTKGVTSRPIDPNLEDGTKTLLKYLNFLLPIILIIGYGIFRWQVKTNKKNKLMSTDYV